MINEIILVLLLVSVLHPYVLYPISLMVIELLTPKRSGPKISAVLPTVSILIPMYNEEMHAENKVINCLSQDYPPEKIEILIGSDGSTDRTHEILKHYVHHSRIRIYHFSRSGKAVVLNRLVEHATSEILLLTDADVLLAEDAISTGVKYFSDETVGAVGGNINFFSNSGVVRESFYWRFDKLLRQLESRIATTIVVSGSIFMLRRELYQPLPTMVGVADDLTLPLSIIERGHKVYFAENIKGTTGESGSVWDEYHRRIRVAMLNYQSLLRQVNLLHPRFGFVAYALLSHKVLRWLVPVFLIVLFVFSLVIPHTELFPLVILYAQLAFYGAAAIGGILLKAGRDRTPFRYPLYFLLVNFALLVGMLKMFSNSHSGTWEASR